MLCKTTLMVRASEQVLWRVFEVQLIRESTSKMLDRVQLLASLAQ
jgi:hypothetical protein